MTDINLPTIRNYTVENLTLNLLGFDRKVLEITYMSNTNESFRLCLLDLTNHTITFEISDSLTKHLKALNKIIHNLFPNSYIHIFSALGNYTLKLNNQNYDFSSNTDDFPDQITLQGRSFEDHCVKLINLAQNFRWTAETQNHQY